MQQVSWTHALRQIVINCYKYHGREDLLPAFNEEDERAQATANSGQPGANTTTTTTNGPTIVTAQVVTTAGPTLASKKVKAQRNISQNVTVNHTGINVGNANIPITTLPITTADGTQLTTVQGVNVRRLNRLNIDFCPDFFFEKETMFY